MNTSENTKTLESLNTEANVGKKDWKIEELLHGVVGHPNGFFYKIVPKDVAFVYLSLCGKEQLTTVPVIKLLEEVNNGTMTFYAPGNDSWKQEPLPEDVLMYHGKVLNAMILNQLAMEANDQLKDTPEYDNYLNNQVRKTNQILQRKAEKMLKHAYGAEQEMLFNVFNSIENFTKKFALKMPHSCFFLNSIIDEYDKDPTKFLNRNVELNKLQS
jgi:hypothetical protein